jgi:LPS export ABC transporter protein LptC
VSVTDEASKGGKKVSFAADWGLLSNDGTLFTLNGDARAFITGSKTQSELVSDQLNYDSRNLLIISKKAFTLMTPNSSLSGVGLKANLVNEIFTVTENLKANHNAI